MNAGARAVSSLQSVECQLVGLRRLDGAVLEITERYMSVPCFDYTERALPAEQSTGGSKAGSWQAARGNPHLWHALDDGDGLVELSGGHFVESACRRKMTEGLKGF